MKNVSKLYAAIAVLAFVTLTSALPPVRQWVDNIWIKGSLCVQCNPAVSVNTIEAVGTTGRPGGKLSDDDGGTYISYTDTTVLVDADEGVKVNGARFSEAIGDTVASANNLVLGYDGSMFPVSGTTTINGISVTDWPSGSVIRLFFNASVTVADSASVTAPYQEINLSTGSNLSATKNDVLTLILNGSEWFEVSRTVNAD